MTDKLESFGFKGEDIGVGLLESITTGLYRSPFDVLREYISNEIDNDPEPSYVEVALTPASKTVTIRGDGPGMDWDRFRSAVRVGISLKDPLQDIGFRGIGIWAGVAAAETLRVATKSASDPNEYELIVNCVKLRSYFQSGGARDKPLIDALNECAGFRKRRMSRSPGTEVALEGVTESFKSLLDSDEVRGYLTGECPVIFERGFTYADSVNRYLRKEIPGYRSTRILLDGTPIRGLHVEPDTQQPIFGTLEIAGGKSHRALAKYWICHPKSAGRPEEGKGYDRGLRIRVRNFVVVQPENLLAELSTRGLKSLHLYNYWVGEIHAIHPELRPNSERNDLENSIAKDQLMDELETLFETVMEPISRLTSDVYNLGEDADTYLKVDTTVSRADYPDLRSVYAAEEEANTNLTTFRRQSERAQRVLKKNRKTSGVGYAKEQLDGPVGRKVERGIRRLEARLKHLAELREKYEQRPVDRPDADETTVASAEDEVAVVPETTTGIVDHGVDAAASGPPAGSQRAVVPGGVVEEEIQRILTFETSAEAVLKCVIVAAIEEGFLRGPEDLRRLSGTAIRVAQRRE